MGDSSRHVNNLLHTLRGEQFRHAQNVLRSRTHLSYSHTHNSPTLPIDLTLAERLAGVEDVPLAPASTSAPPPRPGAVAGPGPPKSWTLTKPAKDPRATPAWRARALLPTLSRLPLPCAFAVDDHGEVVPAEGYAVPPLTLLCLRVLLTAYATADFVEDITPWIPPHLRRDIVRHTSVHAPLPLLRLRALHAPEGHADGEAILVGPAHTLQGNHFRRERSAAADGPEEASLDWESPLHASTPSPLHTLVLLSVHLSVSNLLGLPATITHLALMDLPSPIPLHRLPSLCPSLVVLDLSFNSWLNPATKGGQSALQMVQWRRWTELRVLGLRECQLNATAATIVNKGRWDDVEIII